MRSEELRGVDIYPHPLGEGIFAYPCEGQRRKQ